jgi:hypothetical protein
VQKEASLSPLFPLHMHPFLSVEMYVYRKGDLMYLCRMCFLYIECVLSGRILYIECVFYI